MSDDFVRDLEEELVAAARFRARRHRSGAPRALGALLAAAAVALVVAVAVLAYLRGADRAADDPPVPPPPGVTLPLRGMLPVPDCGHEPSRGEPAADALPPMAVFDRPQAEPDGLPIDGARLPLFGFDHRESRRPGREALRVELTLVPSRDVSTSGRCGPRHDDGPGLCIVAGLAQPPAARCFTATEIAAGRAVAQLGRALLVGVVPDGVAAVTLAAGRERVRAPVVENTYEAVLPGVAPGAPIHVALERDGCRPTVAPALRDRVTALHEPAQPGFPLPPAALHTLNWWTWQLDAVVADGARFWGGGDGVDFWVVPVVPKGGGRCAAATRVCVVAVPDDAAADAHCLLEDDDDGESWRLAPLLPAHAAVYGVVPDGVEAADVTIDGRTARVEAGLNVIGGVLPFPYRDGADARVELIRRGPGGGRKPRVAVVAAGGDADAIRERLVQAGYESAIATGATPRQRTVVYWRPGLVTREDVARVAALVGADERRPRDGAEGVDEAGAPVVVVVGSG